jgi:predicted 3-demethylubiquinone-9 3-methyltransferase (glyoxalase superfamily)
VQIKQRITPFLSYFDQAEEAAKFYMSVLPESKLLRTVTNPSDGAVITVEFELAGMKFVALNAGQHWKFTEAMSLMIASDTQEEIDTLWTNLVADGGSELACGWLKDKFGMCWQVVPSQLQQWLESNDPEAIQRMFEALWQMKKLDIATLQKAFDGNVDQFSK